MRIGPVVAQTVVQPSFYVHLTKRIYVYTLHGARDAWDRTKNKWSTMWDAGARWNVFVENDHRHQRDRTLPPSRPPSLTADVLGSCINMWAITATERPKETRDKG